jgi:hypothetical protein
MYAQNLVRATPGLDAYVNMLSNRKSYRGLPALRPTWTWAIGFLYALGFWALQRESGKYFVLYCSWRCEEKDRERTK